MSSSSLDVFLFINLKRFRSYCVVPDDSENMKHLELEAQELIVRALSLLGKAIKDLLDGKSCVQRVQIMLDNKRQCLTLAKYLNSNDELLVRQLETVLEWRKNELEEYKATKNLLINFVQHCDNLPPGSCS